MIRPMEPDDADAVVDVVVAADMFAPDESGIVRDLLGHYTSGSAEGHACVVDAHGDDLAGVAYYRPKGPADRVWDLTMIAVRPELQGRGRGRALLRHVEDDLRARGQRLLLVDTSGAEQYSRTRAFYARCGYAAEARVRDYWADGDDLVVFTKRIAS